jgi:hypothetical protein
VKLELDSLFSCLEERYRVMERPARRRRRAAAIDRYLDDLRSFTLRRVQAGQKDKRKFSLQCLADELGKKHGREFHRSTVKRALERHQMYELW